MIPKECKRLAEVDFPVAEVSKHSAREKSIRHGHPSTLHLWWARRPLAACRAMLMALLLPDPCDVNCPADFRQEARRLLKLMPGGAAVAPVSSPAKKGDGAEDDAAGHDLRLRKALLSFIADFANWDNSAKPAYLECARGLVKAAHGQEPPLVVDPFAGGGSIPLEALRVGCDAFASDLNPVACLILKVLLEDIPRHGPALADELRRVGKQIKDEAEKELAEFYPPDPDGARPIAYLWARTVRCEAVGCGAEIPLMRSFWLCKKANRRRALRLVPVAPGFSPTNAALKGGDTSDLNTITSERGAWGFDIFEPKSESEVRGGTVNRGNAVCPCCNTVLPVARVRVQLAEQHGGADVIFDDKGRRIGGARPLAVVTLDENKSGRQYRLPTEHDYEAVRHSAIALAGLTLGPSRDGLSTVPDETIPRTELRRISLPLYGAARFRDMYTPRQLVCLSSIAGLMNNDGRERMSPAVKRLLALCLDKTADLNNANTPWKPDAECPVHTLARHDVAMAWDYAEAAPLGEASASFMSAFDRTANAIIPSYCGAEKTAEVQAVDACNHSLPDASAAVWFTDPPYYDSVPYAHLSDFFYIWARRALDLPGETHDGRLTPKDEECVVDRPHSQMPEAKTPADFERRIGLAMREGVRVTDREGVGCVVFAHKTTEGWEALLTGVTANGWTITGSWPIATEMQSRLNARDNASLSASVHLVCRPRPTDAGIGGWEDILRELPNRIGDWMERLSGEGIRGADLVFSCIGPALELFSKYERVETAEGREVKLAEFLEKVWEVVGRTALQQILGTAEARARNGAAGALEEDARLTALFLWTLQSTDKRAESEKSKVDNEDAGDDEGDEDEGSGKVKKGYTLIYDVARRFAQPLGIHLENWEGRIIETKKGVVRLLPVSERAEQLFGQAGTEAVARAIERSGGQDAQYTLFPDDGGTGFQPVKSGKGKQKAATGKMPVPHQATTLDRIHAAMLLQAGGQATALRAMLEAETQRSPDFLRLANALSALYPKESEEKRLLDAMLLVVRR
ncbi:MAG: DUF1156 domain-containing protein [Terriglobia bacterium]